MSTCQCNAPIRCRQVLSSSAIDTDCPAMLLYCLQKYMGKVAEGALARPPLLAWARMVGDELFWHQDLDMGRKFTTRS